MNNRPHAHYVNEMFACTGEKKAFLAALQERNVAFSIIPASMLMDADYIKIYF